MTFSKYLEIPHIGEVLEDNIEYGSSFGMEEKIDGSLFRFGVSVERGVMVGSKNADMTDIPQSMFSKAIDYVYEVIGNKTEQDRMLRIGEVESEIIFFGEFLQSPRHNTLSYSRVPKHNIILFDVMIDGIYQSYKGVEGWASYLDLEVVPVLKESDTMFSLGEIKSQLNMYSILGEVPIEGVVIKSYDSSMHIRKHDYPFMLKYVRDDFKEMNSKNWKERKQEEKPIEHILKAINKEKVWEKVIQHARDDGKLEGRMQDMRILNEYLNTDIEHQWKEAIKEELWNVHRQEIKMRMIKGLPEYYKQILSYNNNNTISKSE